MFRKLHVCKGVDNIFGFFHEISVHIAYAQMSLINAHANVSSEARCLFLFELSSAAILRACEKLLLLAYTTFGYR